MAFDYLSHQKLMNELQLNSRYSVYIKVLSTNFIGVLYNERLYRLDLELPTQIPNEKEIEVKEPLEIQLTKKEDLKRKEYYLSTNQSEFIAKGDLFSKITFQKEFKQDINIEGTHEVYIKDLKLSLNKQEIEVRFTFLREFARDLVKTIKTDSISMIKLLNYLKLNDPYGVISSFIYSLDFNKESDLQLVANILQSNLYNKIQTNNYLTHVFKKKLDDNGCVVSLNQQEKQQYTNDYDVKEFDLHQDDLTKLTSSDDLLDEFIKQTSINEITVDEIKNEDNKNNSFYNKEKNEFINIDYEQKLSIIIDFINQQLSQTKIIKEVKVHKNNIKLDTDDGVMRYTYPGLDDNFVIKTVNIEVEEKLFSKNNKIKND